MFSLIRTSIETCWLLAGTRQPDWRAVESRILGSGLWPEAFPARSVPWLLPSEPCRRSIPAKNAQGHRFRASEVFAPFLLLEPTWLALRWLFANDIAPSQGYLPLEGCARRLRAKWDRATEASASSLPQRQSVPGGTQPTLWRPWLMISRRSS